jgi:hypothetical protein
VETESIEGEELEDGLIINFRHMVLKIADE